MTVKQQQLLLEYLGYSPGALDGIMGSQTKAAITEFQKDNGLVADGICGQQTEKMLKNNVAVGTLRKNVANTTVSSTNNVATADKTEAVGSGIYGSKWFSREEFRCQCGGRYCNGFPYEPEEKLIRLADKVREHFGVPVTVSSGVRCEVHNREVDGAANSKHRFGKAMDFCVKGVSSSMVDAYVGSLVGVSYHYRINNNYIHMDV